MPDGWGMPFYLEFPEHGAPWLCSAGPDLTPGTSDDLRTAFYTLTDHD